jgi:hypothetical protein
VRLLPPRVVLDLTLDLVVRFDVARALPERVLALLELPARDVSALR